MSTTTDLLKSICGDVRTYKQYLRTEITLQNQACAMIWVPRCEAKVDAGMDKKQAFKKDETPWPLFDSLPADEVALRGVQPVIDAVYALQPHKALVEKSIRKAAKKLPIYAWVKTVRGAGEFNLGRILGETGDLLNYDNPAKVWKRMGLAPGQKKIRGDSEENTAAAIQAGYNPRRRSVVWNLGACIIKADMTDGCDCTQRRAALKAAGSKEKLACPPEHAGPWRGLFLAEKDRQAQLHPELKPKHRMMRAQRYMEKRFLRDLWREWRRVEAEGMVPTTTSMPTPVATEIHEYACV